MEDEGTVVQNIAFDTVAGIEMLDGGEARVHLIDGTVQRVLVAIGWRVLYLHDDAGRAKTIDLAEISAIEFLR
jgi:hypothetical protein